MQRSKAELLALNGWELAGTASRCSEAMARLPLLQPDLLLADSKLSDGSLDRLIPMLGPRRPPFLVWTGAMDEAAQLRTLLVGALGFLPETNSPLRFQGQLQAALELRCQLTPLQARSLLQRLYTPRLPAAQACSRDNATDAAPAGMAKILSTAQQALLSLLAHGWLTREIAKAWSLDSAEVERRVGQLLRLVPRLVPRLALVA
jgi:two-component system, NarL family, response regulator DevR